jgi:hypothetical protein
MTEDVTAEVNKLGEDMSKNDPNFWYVDLTDAMSLRPELGTVWERIPCNTVEQQAACRKALALHAANRIGFNNTHGLPCRAESSILETNDSEVTLKTVVVANEMPRIAEKKDQGC